MRFSYDKVLANVRERVEAKFGTRDERGHKALYQELKISKDGWNRKWKGETK